MTTRFQGGRAGGGVREYLRSAIIEAERIYEPNMAWAAKPYEKTSWAYRNGVCVLRFLLQGVNPGTLGA